MIWTITIDCIEDDCNIDIEKDEDDMLTIATMMMMIEVLLCRHLPTQFPQSNLSRYTICLRYLFALHNILKRPTPSDISMTQHNLFFIYINFRQPQKPQH